MYALTLAFSMTLLGETLDYPTYLFSHRQAGRRCGIPCARFVADPAALRHYPARLSGDDRPGRAGLSQLGVFTIAGIIAAVTTTRWLLPSCCRRTQHRRELSA